MTSTSPKPSLYIGRFQPFHLGHLDALRQILANEDSVIIGIGSAQKSGEPSNPFSFEDRKKMIEAVFADPEISAFTREKIVGIFPIPDIGDNARWVAHVTSLVPPFGKIYSGTPLVQQLFRDADIEVFPLQMRLLITATEIRRRITTGEPWKYLVPAPVFSLAKTRNLS